MTRLFDAPRHLVFEAMTKPEHVKVVGPPRRGLLGPGLRDRSPRRRRLALRNRHPKGEAAFHGEYRRSRRPSRLVFTEIFEPFPDAYRW